MGIERLSLEDITCVLILMFFGVAGAIPGIAPNQASEMTGSPASGLMFAAGIGSQLLVNAAVVVLALRQAPRLRSGLGALQFAGMLVAFAVCSAIWSQDPVLTARRAVPFALATLFGLYLAMRHPLRRQLVLFEAALLALAVSSAILALGFPRLGLDASTGHFGNWQGVFSQKNACGRAMVFATAVVLAQGRVTLRRAASLAVFLLVLAMSGSRAAWIIEALLLVVAACHALLGRLERGSKVGLATLVLAASVLTVALGKLYFPLLAGLVGREPTLTGRTAIWAQVWVAILKHPWLGYGFSAFWRGTRGASFAVVVALKFVLFHAHNGFLELWLELGAAGLALFFLSYLRGWQKLWPMLFRGRRAGEPAASAWPLYVLILIAAYDVDENTLLTFNGLFWVFYVHALATIELSARRPALVPETELAANFQSRHQPGFGWAGESGWGRELAEARPWF